MNFGKKILMGISFAFITTFIFASSNYAQTTGVVTTETVRMRKEPSTDSSIITLLSQDYEVEIIEKQGDWYKVKYQEYTGYVSSEFVETNDDENVQTTNEEDKNEDENSQVVDQTNNNEENNTNNTETNQENSNLTEEKKLEINVNKKVQGKQNIYILPLIGTTVIGNIENEDVYIIQVTNGWAYVSKDNILGWIRTENLIEQTEQTQNEEQNQDSEETNKEDNEQQDTPEENTNNSEETEQNETTEKIGYISKENVNFREAPDMSAEIIDNLTQNTEVKIIAEETGWYKIQVNGKTGYVAQNLISDEKVEETTISSRSLEEPREIKEDNTNNIQSQIVEYAKSFLGSKYVYGGASPSGFDCSGLVQYVYKHFGYNVSRSSREQAKDGKEVSKEDLQLGDIIIFKAYDDYSRIGHVGLYIGNNEFIHANDESTGVIITSLSKGKYPERFVTARRIV